MLPLCCPDFPEREVDYSAHPAHAAPQANCDPARHRAEVVDYAWGQEPLPPALAHGMQQGSQEGPGGPEAQRGCSAGQQQQAEDGAGPEPASLPAPGGFDLIAGADLVYDRGSYPALLAALAALAAPHTLLFLAIKLRGARSCRGFPYVVCPLTWGLRP